MRPARDGLVEIDGSYAPYSGHSTNLGAFPEADITGLPDYQVGLRGLLPACAMIFLERSFVACCLGVTLVTLRLQW